MLRIKDKKLIFPKLYFRQYYMWRKKDLQRSVCELRFRIRILCSQKDPIPDPQHCRCNVRIHCQGDYPACSPCGSCIMFLRELYCGICTAFNRLRYRYIILHGVGQNAITIACIKKTCCATTFQFSNRLCMKFYMKHDAT